MSPNEFMDKASRAVASAKLLLVQREFAPRKPETDDDSESK